MKRLVGLFVLFLLVPGFLACEKTTEQEKEKNCIVGSLNKTPTVTILTTPGDCCYGGWAGNVTGKVNNINADSVGIVLYAQTNLYWVQPWADSPWTKINCDGKFVSGTHGGHHYCAILAKKGWVPPSTMGYLPPVGDKILAIACSPVAVRKISFAGLSWQVKQSGGIAIDPGPNYWSDSEQNVWIDGQGRLHLKITNHDNQWYCPEVFTDAYVGYGSYSFEVESRIDLLDVKVVFAGFIYSDEAEEIDIEFSRWGKANDPNAQYVIQPWNVSGNRLRFNLVMTEAKTWHNFNWQANGLTFASYQGALGETGNPVQTWAYSGADSPTPSTERYRFNLWLIGGQAPTDGKEVEVIISAFQKN